MSPGTIVQTAIKRGLDIIAICDHNSSENVKAARDAARGSDLTVIGGMEITSREEVHILGLFREDTMLAGVQKVIYDNLPGKNNPDFFGDQLVMDERDRVTGENTRLLIGATGLTVKEIVSIVHQYEGIAVASHIDRPSFSLISQLGFVPDNLGLDAVEVFSGKEPVVPEQIPVIFSSDAHRPGEIGRRRTGFFMKSACFNEIKMALDGSGDRRIVV